MVSLPTPSAINYGSNGPLKKNLFFQVKHLVKYILRLAVWLSCATLQDASSKQQNYQQGIVHGFWRASTE